MMIVSLIVIVSLTSGAEAVKCYKCSNTPTNVPCDDSNQCEGTSCYFALQLNSSLYYTGCAEDEAPTATCFTQGQRRICSCSTPLCNYGMGMGKFQRAFMPPVMDIDLSTFFETAAAIVPAAPVAAAASTEKAVASTAEAAKEITSVAPADVVATSTQAAKDNSSEESSESPAIDTNTTATTPKPNSGSAAPFLIAAAFFGTALLF